MKLLVLRVFMAKIAIVGKFSKFQFFLGVVIRWYCFQFFLQLSKKQQRHCSEKCPPQMNPDIMFYIVQRNISILSPVEDFSVLFKEWFFMFFQEFFYTAKIFFW